MLQHANQHGSYESYVKDGVPYTVITFPNTLITPTLATMMSPGMGQPARRESAGDSAGPSIDDVISAGRGGRGRLPSMSGHERLATVEQVDEFE